MARLQTLTILFSIFFSINSFSQDQYWTTDIASLIYDNCSSCHHDSGIAPFSLMSYEETIIFVDEIHHAIEERSMPPWPADPDYRHFVGEALLEQSEIDAIHSWINMGMPYGDPADEPTPPVFFEQGSLLDQIDLTLQIEPYTLQSNTDEYRWFVIENPYDETIYISELEVISGLNEVVHHADLFLDYTGQSLAYDLADPLPGFNSSTGSPVNNYYINAWQPGGNIQKYPPNWGIEVPPNADFVFEIHYGPGGIGQVDDTKMNIKLINNPVNVRAVQTAWLLSDSAPILIDGPLVIPANEVVTFHQVSAPLSTDLSLISICPHMHWLGKSYKVWFEKPDGEIVPLIDIPHWDFHWQKYYTFQYVQPIPAGSVLKSEGVYDNTINNHDNPNNPPITVSKGITTDDEMFLCYFIFANYEDGDENILLDSSIITTTTLETELNNNWNLYPNPTIDEFRLEYYAQNNSDSNTQFRIFDHIGNTVFQTTRKNTSNFIQESFNVQHLPKGVYWLEWEENNQTQSAKFIKK